MSGAGVTTLGDVLRRSTEHLAAKGVEAPRFDAELLLGRALGLERIELYMHLDRPLSESELGDARALVARRARREPLQYVLGEWGFRRLVLTVDRRALIPRPETEVVVGRALALLAAQDRNPLARIPVARRSLKASASRPRPHVFQFKPSAGRAPRVLDVGTGSGAIALAVADEHPGAQVTAIDISADALALARENAERTGLGVELVRHDLRAGLPRGPWDLVVSNPPYVDRAERDILAPEVREWEPDEALYGAGAHEEIARRAYPELTAGGALVLEVGDGQATGVALTLTELGYRDVDVILDLAGRERVVAGSR